MPSEEIEQPDDMIPFDIRELFRLANPHLSEDEIEERLALPEDAEPTGRFALIPANAVVNLPPVRWLIKGELPEEGLAVLYGGSGTGKSFVALDYALTLAQDRLVVYIAAEGFGGYPARLLAWRTHHQKEFGQLHFIHQSLDMMSDIDAVGLVESVRAMGVPALIVIDTLARSMSGEENSARDMGAMIRQCDFLRQRTAACVLLVHHTGKNGATERGSSALRGAADVMLELTSEEDGHLFLVCTKSKDAAAPKPRALRLVTISTGRKNEDGEPETSCVVLPSDAVYEPNKITGIERKLLEVLALDVFDGVGASFREIQGAYPNPTTPERTLQWSLSKLKRVGYIVSEGRGGKYHLTKSGRERLDHDAR